MKKLLFLLCAILIYSCQPHGAGKPEVIDIKSYYYPLDNLQGQGKIYEYKASSPDFPDYLMWVQYTKDSTGTPVLVMKRLTPDFKLQQTTVEVVSNEGTFMRSYAFNYCKDGLTSCPPSYAKITDAVTFPWKAAVDSVMAYRFTLEYVEPVDENTTTVFTRDRYCQGLSSVSFEGKNYPAVVFKTKQVRTNSLKTGGFWKAKYDGEEIYAQGIGLVSSTQKFDEKTTVVYRLSRIFAPAQ